MINPLIKKLAIKFKNIADLYDEGNISVEIAFKHMRNIAATAINLLQVKETNIGREENKKDI